MIKISLLNLEFDDPSISTRWKADLIADGIPVGAILSTMPGCLEFVTMEPGITHQYVLNMCEAITLNDRHDMVSDSKGRPVTLYDLCVSDITSKRSHLSVVVNNNVASKKVPSNVRRVSKVLAYEPDEAIDLPLARAC
ncbi:MAG: hypothetical protein B7Y00_01255 [Sphingomonadales bacterium 17-56-6]|nr:MAG: hypothetical protein B7Y00_01255 [Sphingomonadales bacterium 17-56-6]